MEKYPLSVYLHLCHKLGNYGPCSFLTKVLSLFFKSVTTQLLYGAEEISWKLHGKEVLFRGTDVDGTFQFVAEMLTRICRRGSAGKMGLYSLIGLIVLALRSFEVYFISGHL